MAHILVIDDDPQVLAVVERTLQLAGHEVSLAANGNQGWQTQCAHPAALVITDLLMPEKDGLQTLEDFRKEFPKVPIITMSGRAGADFYLHMATHLGAVHSLAKPFRPRELLRVVEKALQQ